MGQFASTLMAMTAPISCVSKLFFDRDTALIGEFMGNQNSNPLGFMAIVKRTLPPPYIAILNAGAHVYSTMNQSTPKDKPKINATENMAAMQIILDYVIAEIRQKRETAADGDVDHSRRYVWASMIPGHASCRRNGADRRLVRNGPVTRSQKSRDLRRLTTGSISRAKAPLLRPRPQQAAVYCISWTDQCFTGGQTRMLLIACIFVHLAL